MSSVRAEQGLKRRSLEDRLGHDIRLERIEFSALSASCH
jgi:hypothetical protein